MRVELTSGGGAFPGVWGSAVSSQQLCNFYNVEVTKHRMPKSDSKYDKNYFFASRVKLASARLQKVWKQAYLACELTRLIV